MSTGGLGRRRRARCAGVRADALLCTEDDALCAIDDTCTHLATSLADGWVEGHLVECMLQESCFNLRPVLWMAHPPSGPVRTHEVSVEDGIVYVFESD